LASSLNNSEGLDRSEELCVKYKHCHARILSCVLTASRPRWFPYTLVFKCSNGIRFALSLFVATQTSTAKLYSSLCS